MDSIFGGQGHNFFYDDVAFAVSLIPFVLVAALIVASRLEEPLRVRATIRKRKGNAR